MVIDFTTTSTSLTMRFYPNDASGSANSNVLYLDNLVVIPLTFTLNNIVTDSAIAEGFYEENTLTGATITIGGGNTTSVETLDTNGSTYAVNSVSPAGGFKNTTVTIPCTNATTYNVNFDYRVGNTAGGNPGLRAWGGVGSSSNNVQGTTLLPFNTDGSWHSYPQFTITTNATEIVARFYTTVNDVTGAEIIIDNLIITPV